MTDPFFERFSAAIADHYAVEREIEDLAALVEHAGGKAAVLGYSSGAVLALRAAAAIGAWRSHGLAMVTASTSARSRTRR